MQQTMNPRRHKQVKDATTNVGNEYVHSDEYMKTWNCCGWLEKFRTGAEM